MLKIHIIPNKTTFDILKTRHTVWATQWVLRQEDTNTSVLRPFFWDLLVSRCQKRTSELYGQGKINRGRHTNHPAGRHSIRIKVKTLKTTFVLRQEQLIVNLFKFCWWFCKKFGSTFSVIGKLDTPDVWVTNHLSNRCLGNIRLGLESGSVTHTFPKQFLAQTSGRLHRCCLT